MSDEPCGNCGSWPSNPSYPCEVRTVTDTDAINASNANQSAEDLSARTEYLRCFLESLELGTAHIVKDVVFDNAVEVGHVVYYDAETSKYKPAFVAIDGRDVYDNESCDTYTLDSAIMDSSYPFGVVVENGSNTAVCIGGQFKTDNYTAGLIENLLKGYTDLSSTEKTGQMYLSMQTLYAGTVQKNKPALGVPICFVTPDPAAAGKFLVTVRPNLHDLMLAHRHYSFRLHNEPAVNFPVGYNHGNPADTPTTTWNSTVGTEEDVDVYLYTYSSADGPGTPSNCPYTVNTGDGSVLVKVATAKYAGNDATYGGMITTSLS